MTIRSQRLTLAVDAQEARLSVLRRLGERPPLLCLHGFGSTKEDYADLALHPRFADRDLALVDAPGFGRSSCDDPAAVTIPFLRNLAAAVADHLGLSRFHLLGHSMGGLTALLLARSAPERILSFTNIEGNLAPEDCFLSRQILEHTAQDPEHWLAAFIEREAARPQWSSRLYAAALSGKVHPPVIEPIFRSMVALSDEESLLEAFETAPYPRMFVYGEQNRGLSYLPRLKERGVALAEIPYSAHFPMYANPQALWSRLAEFLDEVDRSDNGAESGARRAGREQETHP